MSLWHLPSRKTNVVEPTDRLQASSECSPPPQEQINLWRECRQLTINMYVFWKPYCLADICICLDVVWMLSNTIHGRQTHYPHHVCDFTWCVWEHAGRWCGNLCTESRCHWSTILFSCILWSKINHDLADADHLFSSVTCKGIAYVMWMYLIVSIVNGSIIKHK